VLGKLRRDQNPLHNAAQMTVLEIRLFLNNKQTQAMVLNTSLMLCGKLAPYEQQCK
jgi:hypothetical protein